MDVQVNGQTYRIGTMNAREQFHIVRRMLPLVGELLPVIKAGQGSDLKALGLEVLPPLAAALAKLTDADADYCLFGLLKAVQRQQPNGMGWGPVCTGALLMYADISLPAMLQLAGHAFTANMAGFFDALPSDLRGAAPTPSAPFNG